MFCEKCGKEIGSGEKFCPVCGTKISWENSQETGAANGSGQIRRTHRRRNHRARPAAAGIFGRLPAESARAAR